MDLFLFYLWCIWLCRVSCAEKDDGDTKRTYKTDSVKIVLKPPTNITVFRITGNSMYIAWQAPAVYPIHDQNATYVDTDDNTTSTVQPSPNTTVISTVTTPVSTEVHQTSNTTEASKGDNSTNGTTATPKIPFCLPSGFFLDQSTTNTTNSTSVKNMDVNFVSNVSLRENMTEIQSNDLVVPFDQACVEKYIVHYMNNATGQNLTLVVQPSIDDEDITEANITSLTSNTTYILYVAAQYVSGHILNSQSRVVTTKQTECHCNFEGTIAPKVPAGEVKLHTITCNLSSLRWCFCRPGYTGVFCELCAPGFYRTSPLHSCHRCPCSPHLTIKPTCHFKEGFLVCDACKTRFTGRMCEQCANGFYRYHRQCIPCECHGNTDPNSHYMCHSTLGYCEECLYNTTGFHCELCLDGYVGDPIHKKNCRLRSEVSEEGGLPKGVIAGICIAVILTLSGLVGFAVYRRWKIFPPKKPFWTVELKEDRDSVNFSALPEHDFQNDPTGVDDLTFYDGHGGKSSSKGVSQYSPLKEDI